MALGIARTGSATSSFGGFHAEFEDLPDFILKITKRIWEERGVDTIRDYYAEGIPVRSPSGVVVGPEPVVRATMATLAEFPDRTLLGEDVIWTGDAASGYLSSHRLLSTATHARHGAYGPATGKALCYRIIADCACRDNQVYDEWLIRDQGAIVRQIGIDPKAYAAARIASEGGPEACQKPFTDDGSIADRYVALPQPETGPGAAYRELLTRIMAADFRAIGDVYDRAVQQEQPGGVTVHGREAVDSFWMNLRSAFPDAVFRVEHAIGREDPRQAPRAALRWSLRGRHSGFGAFGEPTGAEVYVMGMSHAEFGPFGLNREWVLYDETAVWKQILMQTG